MTISTAVEVERFITDFSQHMSAGNAAVFAGAGLSVPSGAVDWKSLLKGIAEELGLLVDEERDLVALAQYHFNRHGRNRSQISQAIVEGLGHGLQPHRGHQILAMMPISTYWTTNYDHLLETSLRAAGKRVDVKHDVKHLATTAPRRDAVVYKMHGDAGSPGEAVVIKDDFESYHLRRSAFTTALAGDLVEKTFLFVGLSFSDPQLEYVLARIRSTFGENQRRHYCLIREPKRTPSDSEESFVRAQTRFGLAVEDLQRFNIQAIVVAEYEEITPLLERILNSYRRRTIFISGSAHIYGSWEPAQVTVFLASLGRALIQEGFRVVTGMGLGLGDAVISGVVPQVYSSRDQYVEDLLISRPFPQAIADDEERARIWKEYRKELIAPAGLSLFLFGNKLQKGQVVFADGMRSEFEIARESSLVIPVGATGFMANELWKEVMAAPATYFTEPSPDLIKALETLGESVDDPIQLIEPILGIIRLVSGRK